MNARLFASAILCILSSCGLNPQTENAQAIADRMLAISDAQNVTQKLNYSERARLRQSYTDLITELQAEGKL